MQKNRIEKLSINQSKRSVNKKTVSILFHKITGLTPISLLNKQLFEQMSAIQNPQMTQYSIQNSKIAHLKKQFYGSTK